MRDPHVVAEKNNWLGRGSADGCPESVPQVLEGATERLRISMDFGMRVQHVAEG